MNLRVAAITVVLLGIPLRSHAQSNALGVSDGSCYHYAFPVVEELQSDIDAIRAFVDPKATTHLINDDAKGAVLISVSKERPIFVSEVARALSLIQKTERGREIFHDLHDRERPVRIVYLRGSAPVWHHLEGSPYSVIFLDPQMLPGTETEEGCDPSSIARVLAHELGHANGEMGETANVNINENPVAEDLGEHNRSGYTPGCDPSVKRNKDD